MNRLLLATAIAASLLTSLPALAAPPTRAQFAVRDIECQKMSTFMLKIHEEKKSGTARSAFKPIVHKDPSMVKYFADQYDAVYNNDNNAFDTAMLAYSICHDFMAKND